MTDEKKLRLIRRVRRHQNSIIKLSSIKSRSVSSINDNDYEYILSQIRATDKSVRTFDRECQINDLSDVVLSIAGMPNGAMFVFGYDMGNDPGITGRARDIAGEFRDNPFILSSDGLVLVDGESGETFLIDFSEKRLDASLIVWRLGPIALQLDRFAGQ